MDEQAATLAIRALTCILAAGLSVFAGASAGQAPEPPAARVFNVEIRCSELKAADPRACALALLRYVRSQVARVFVDRNALNATESELQRLLDYNEVFERHDRAQRARKRAELDERLADHRLPPSERPRLQSFREILLRLEAYERDLDAGTEAREPIAHELLRSWIEGAKLNAMLYARYGGTVGVAAYGPYPHGAFVQLISEHRARGDIAVLDTGIANYFDTALQAPPRILHMHGEPDFTPFWARPIAPSYFPN